MVPVTLFGVAEAVCILAKTMVLEVFDTSCVIATVLVCYFALAIEIAIFETSFVFFAVVIQDALAVVSATDKSSLIYRMLSIHDNTMTMWLAILNFPCVNTICQV